MTDTINLGHFGLLCSSCGSEVNIEYSFCTQCASKINCEEMLIKYYFSKGYKYNVIIAFLLVFCSETERTIMAEKHGHQKKW